jgi:hypothetical protein
MLKEKYGEPKETRTASGKEIRPAELSEKNPYLFWQDGTVTIRCSDALVAQSVLQSTRSWTLLPGQEMPPTLRNTDRSTNRRRAICDLPREEYRIFPRALKELRGAGPADTFRSELA